MQQFHKKSGMPGVIGAIDCTHVPIQSPGTDDSEIYRNRKGFFSINVQLISDCTNFITDVVARWPGSVHDSTIFDNSAIRATLETAQDDGYLVGDGGYACRRYMLTPLANPTTTAEKAYNNAQVLARNCIERTNGILKRRFPALRYGMRLKLERTLEVIVATVVLHNIAVLVGDEEPDDDKELEALVDRRLTEQQNNNDVESDPPTEVGRTATGVRQALINAYF